MALMGTGWSIELDNLVTSGGFTFGVIFSLVSFILLHSWNTTAQKEMALTSDGTTTRKRITLNQIS